MKLTKEQLLALKQKRASLTAQMRAILDAAGEEKLTDENRTKFDTLRGEVDELTGRIDREESLQSIEDRNAASAGTQTVETGDQTETQSTEERSETKPKITVGNDRQRRAILAQHMLRMFQGIATRNSEQVSVARQNLAREGFYGEEHRDAGDQYSTLVNADGAILLPTVVVQEIEEIGEIVGVTRRLVQVFNHVVGTLRVPAATGTLRAAAVAEGGTFTASKRAFGSVSLNPKKWGLIVPYTYEINLEAGPQILDDIERAIKRGFEWGEDDALFNGDGTSDYNSIDGILSSNRSSVAEYTIVGDAFASMTADEAIMVRTKIPAALRAQGVYAFHPDMEPVLHKMKDGAGAYIYAYNATTGVATLAGRPVVYTEVLPDASDSAEETTFGVFGAFRAFKLAVGQGMTAESLSEGSVPDATDGTAINLASSDQRALKVRQLIDMDCNFETAFCKITTGSTPEG